MCKQLCHIRFSPILVVVEVIEVVALVKLINLLCEKVMEGDKNWDLFHVLSRSSSADKRLIRPGRRLDQRNHSAGN